MGFFLEYEPPTPPARTPRVKREKLSFGGVGCGACPLKASWPKLACARMPAAGPDDATILILGEAPGETEDREGRPFVGNSGKLLRAQIPAKWHNLVVFQNVVRCRPDDNRTPTDQEVTACSVYLEEDVNRFPIKAILGVGSVPLRRYYPGASITDAHGLKFPVKIGDKILWYFPIVHPSWVLRMGGDKGGGPAYSIFNSDIKRFFSEVNAWPKPRIHEFVPSKVIIPEGQREPWDLLAEMGDPIGLDIETTGLRSTATGAKILTAAVSDGKTTFAWPVEHPTGGRGYDLLLHIAQRRHWVAHNAVFELGWIWHFAKEFFPVKFEDSMAITRLLNERAGMLSLAHASKLFLGTNVKAITDVSSSQLLNYPLEEVLQYNGLDAEACVLIYKSEIQRVSKSNYQRTLRTMQSIAIMELMGLPTDPVATQELDEQWRGVEVGFQDHAVALYESKQFERTYGRKLELANAKDVGQALVEFGKLPLPSTAKGKQYSTDDKDLRQYENENPLVKDLLGYREAAKNRSTYITPMQHFDTFDGLLHPTYNALLTHTLRLSSEDPNIQNWPKRKNREVRRQIRAPKGHLLVAFDYGQLEARVIAMASKDRNFCEALLTDFDVHSFWLKRVLQIYPDYIDHLRRATGQTEEKRIIKAGRDTIKTDFVFASFYGAWEDGISSRTGIPLMIVREILEEFWRTYSGVKAWIKARRAEYKETANIVTLTNRVRHGYVRGNETINNPIQGTAADIVLDAQADLSELSRRLTDPYLHPRINIHDDLTFILPDDERLVQYINTILPILVKVRYDWQIVPLTIEAKVGENWADMEEFTKYTGDYVR